MHQDTNGNTVTHILVVFNNMKMFDMAVECGATINTTNNLVRAEFSLPLVATYQ